MQPRHYLLGYDPFKETNKTDFQCKQIKTGTKIRHPKFGVGTVVFVKRNLPCIFERIKRISLNLKGLEIIENK